MFSNHHLRLWLCLGLQRIFRPRENDSKLLRGLEHFKWEATYTFLVVKKILYNLADDSFTVVCFHRSNDSLIGLSISCVVEVVFGGQKILWWTLISKDEEEHGIYQLLVRYFSGCTSLTLPPNKLKTHREFKKLISLKHCDLGTFSMTKIANLL